MIAHLKSSTKGELLIFSEALIWSLFPVLSILTFSTLPPLFTAAFATIFSSFFFAIVLTYKKLWKECSRNAPWKDIFLCSLFIGCIFYALLFTGMRNTTAGNASIVLLMEVFFFFLILGVLIKHEPIQSKQILGGICMMIGAAFILFPKSSGWHSGDIFIFFACMFTPIGNYFMQRARKSVSSEFILFVRSVISGIFLLILATFLEPMPSQTSLISSCAFLFVNGFLMLGFSKILWLESITLIPMTKAISLASIGPFFTMIFAYFILHEKVTTYQVLGFVPIVLGVLLLTQWQGRLENNYR